MPSSGLLISWAAPGRRLSEGGVLFVFRELALELDFVFVELAFLIEAAEEFVLGDVALLFAFFCERARAFEFGGEGRDVFALEEPDLRWRSQITNKTVAMATASGRR
jgi:hypothetical protein